MDPASASANRYQMSADTGAYSDLNLMAEPAADQNHHRLNSNDFNNYAPPPYPGHTVSIFILQNLK